MLDTTEQTISKIDGVIADIRMINLHLFNYLVGGKREDKRDNERENEREKRMQDFHKLNVAHIHEYVKRVSDYLKRSFKEMEKNKVVLSPIIFRTIKDEYKKEDFLRFENQIYGVKFIISSLDKEVTLHLELYRIVRGGRLSSFALKKLEVTYTCEMSLKFSEGMVSLAGLEAEGKAILEEVTCIMSGQSCAICTMHLSFNAEYKMYLPPTLKQIDTSKDTKNSKKKRKMFYHENCL